ncbi:hypothetical protein AVEN_122298-1 [Araneus ventricosus]|uniref:Uncharacterized protein n=1 Tax=Araneus ventricosus TaxID=182803 RepID=A0A4Y2KVF7_ARAVE|nr:hypothetical protein AVEN_122298-1 [Araneus ventricosus]
MYDKGINESRRYNTFLLPFSITRNALVQPYSMRTRKTWILISKDFISQKKKLKFSNYLRTSSQEDTKLLKMTPLKYYIATIMPRLTDAEICGMVLMNSKTLVSVSKEETQAKEIKCQLTA